MIYTHLSSDLGHQYLGEYFFDFDFLKNLAPILTQFRDIGHSIKDVFKGFDPAQRGPAGDHDFGLGP